jgi:two-component system response regulator
MPAERPILVVDDEDDVRDVILDLLTDERRPALGAENGAQAKALLEGGLLPSVVLLDLMMPVMDGVSFLQWLRAQPAPMGAVPVVVFTAAYEVQVIGADAVYSKPYSLDSVLEAVDRHAPRPAERSRG